MQEFNAKERLRVGPVAADAFLAAKERDDDDGTGRDQFAHTQRDHGEYRARVTGRKRADDHGQTHAEETTKHRQDHQGNGREEIGHVHDVHTGKAAHTRIDRMAKGQHTPLPEQHVIGQRENDRDRHLVHDRQCRIIGKHHRQDGQHDRGNDPGGQCQHQRP